jgi:hypothetical protein
VALQNNRLGRKQKENKKYIEVIYSEAFVICILTPKEKKKKENNEGIWLEIFPW